MNYLSINNTPEVNLQLVAINKVFFTQEMQEQEKKMQDLNFKSFLSIAAVATTLAIGIILGVAVSKTVGALIAVIAVIPLSAWMAFKQQQGSIQLEIDKELEKLNHIYQNMIDAIKGRNGHINGVFRLIDEQKIRMDKVPDSNEIDAFTKVFDQEIFQELNQINFEEFYQEYNDAKNSIDKQDLLSSYACIKLLDECKADLKVELSKIKEYAKIIADSHLEIPLLEEKWRNLQLVCKECIKPYSSYLKVKNGYLAYQDS